MDFEAGVSEPKCKALLLCDYAIIEAGTGKVSIIGTFGDFLLAKIPGKTPSVHAYCQLTDAEGRYDLVLEIHDLKKGEAIARASGPAIEILDRLMRINLIIPIPPLPIEHEGVYDFVLFANGREIDRQPFSVHDQQTIEEGDHDSSDEK